MPDGYDDWSLPPREAKRRTYIQNDEIYVILWKSTGFIERVYTTREAAEAYAQTLEYRDFLTVTSYYVNV